jgi:hypothetical protein
MLFWYAYVLANVRMRVDDVPCTVHKAAYAYNADLCPPPASQKKTRKNIKSI